MQQRIILGGERFALTLERLCHQLLEDHQDFQQSCLVGIQEGGVRLGDRVVSTLSELLPNKKILYGHLDATFHRDDLRLRQSLKPHPAKMDFLVEGKRVILIDDVLHTGRTIRAALTALQHYGRAHSVQLLVLIDRRFSRDLPIQADYVGLSVDTIEDIKVKVEWGRGDMLQDAKVVLYSAS